MRLDGIQEWARHTALWRAKAQQKGGQAVVPKLSNKTNPKGGLLESP